MKHKFTKGEGCTAAGFTVDGESITEISREKEYAVFDYLIEKLRERFDNRKIQLLDIVELFDYDTYHEAEPCDTCGDIASWRTWRI